MKNKLRFSLVLTVAFSLTIPAMAQTGAAVPQSAAASETYVNPAIVPVPRSTDKPHRRTDVVLQRARENPGQYDIAFIGDSITEGWEGAGRNVWNKYYGERKCVNFGVGGDRTQHVLWRFEQGQLDGIKPKVAVLMLGTNNQGDKESEILEGVQLVVQQMRERLPETKILVLGIFPRGQTFSTQRGKLLQVNQALARVADDKNIFYLDFGSKLIEDNGTISKDVMPDHLHLSEKGYEIWAQSIEPKLKELLAR